MFTIIDEILAQVFRFFQSFGWPVVFAAALWYFLQPTLRDLKERRSLAEANDPARRAVLDVELKRVRAKQALEAAQAQEAQARLLGSKKEKEKRK